LSAGKQAAPRRLAFKPGHEKTKNRRAPVLCFLYGFGLGVNADLFSLAVFPLKPDQAVNDGKESMVSADPDIIAGMELCPPLTHDNAAGGDKLTVVPL